MKSGSHFHLIIKLISDTLRLDSKGTMEFCQKRGDFSSVNNCYISNVIQSLVGTVCQCVLLKYPQVFPVKTWIRVYLNTTRHLLNGEKKSILN